VAFDFQHMSNMKKDLEYTWNVGSVSVEMQDRDDKPDNEHFRGQFAC